MYSDKERSLNLNNFAPKRDKCSYSVKLILLFIIGLDFSIKKVFDEDATLSKHKRKFLPPEQGQPACVVPPSVRGLMETVFPEQVICTQETWRSWPPEAAATSKTSLNSKKKKKKKFNIPLHRG